MNAALCVVTVNCKKEEQPELQPLGWLCLQWCSWSVCFLKCISATLTLHLLWLISCSLHYHPFLCLLDFFIVCSICKIVWKTCDLSCHCCWIYFNFLLTCTVLHWHAWFFYLCTTYEQILLQMNLLFLFCKLYMGEMSTMWGALWLCSSDPLSGHGLQAHCINVCFYARF